VFGHTVRGPLKLLKEKWLCVDTDINLLDYVSDFKEKLRNVCEIARENLKKSQSKMKKWYDKDARNRIFKPCDKVLAFFPVPGHPLQVRYFGPYEVDSKVSDLDYVKFPGRRKQRQLCHVNMIKEYFERDDCSSVKPVATLATAQWNYSVEKCFENHDSFVDQKVECNVKLKNSDVLSNLETKVGHLNNVEQNELKYLLQKFHNLFPDVPNKTHIVCHV